MPSSDPTSPVSEHPVFAIGEPVGVLTRGQWRSSVYVGPAREGHLVYVPELGPGNVHVPRDCVRRLVALCTPVVMTVDMYKALSELVRYLHGGGALGVGVPSLSQVAERGHVALAQLLSHYEVP